MYHQAVVPRAGKSDAIAASIRSSHLSFHILRLHAPIPNAEDIQYAEFVDAIGDGNLGYDSHSVPLHMIQEIGSIESSIQYLYSEDVLADPDNASGAPFLARSTSVLMSIIIQPSICCQEKDVHILLNAF